MCDLPLLRVRDPDWYVAERASPRHRRWQEIREAKRSVWARGGSNMFVKFLIRDRSRRAKKR